jgi:D-tyrosyl-tRNA(Tyr) deacylase
LRAVIQRVSFGEVVISDQSVARIDDGLVVLLGVENGDGQDQIRYLARKITNLRIFSDNEGKMNLSVKDIKGKIIVVSQFTLMADTHKGNRPSFIHAAQPEIASPIVDAFVNEVRTYGIETQTGEFGANMLVKIHNSGPVTILIDA